MAGRQSRTDQGRIEDAQALLARRFPKALNLVAKVFIPGQQCCTFWLHVKKSRMIH
jgi:hypothetical protein